MISALYNVIGKRIVVVGLDNPDVYEMPRNVVDILVTKRMGKYVQFKAGIQDVFNQAVVEKQFLSYTTALGETRDRQQVTLQYNPSRLVTAGITINLSGE
jgi:hypothetical protein